MSNYLKQRDKYNNRAEKSLLLAGTAVCGIMAGVVFAPAILPACVLAAAASGTSFAANKIMEKNTDDYEPFSLREKFGNFLKNKIGAFRSNNDDQKVNLDQTIGLSKNKM